MTQDVRIKAARADLIATQSALVAALRDEKSRKRAPLTRQLHEVRQMLDPNYRYLSQAGQDNVIDRIFGQKTAGTFLDIGGYDGLTGSNTVFFEKWRDWTGALVEPVQAQRDRAKSIRSCPCLGYAVADSDGEAAFIAVTTGFTQMSGLSNSYDPAMLERVRADPRHAESVINVPTRTLSAILTETGITDPDFISLDIEGGELTALQGFPFDKHRVGAWAIENNTGSGDIAALMRGHGYDLIEFCGPDEIYVLRNL
jgi:FkbM family methyltransferase